MKAKRSKEMNGVDHKFLDLGNGYVSTIEEKTPESSRSLIRQLHARVCELEDQVEQQRQLTEFCEFGNWMTVHGDKDGEGFTLYRLTKDHATAVCSVYPNSILMIGRKIK